LVGVGLGRRAPVRIGLKLFHDALKGRRLRRPITLRAGAGGHDRSNVAGGFEPFPAEFAAGPMTFPTWLSVGGEATGNQPFDLLETRAIRHGAPPFQRTAA